MARTFVVIGHGLRVLETVKPTKDYPHPDLSMPGKTTDTAPTWFRAPSKFQVGFMTNIESCTPGGCPISVGSFKDDLEGFCNKLAMSSNVAELYDPRLKVGIADPKFQVWAQEPGFRTDCVPNMTLESTYGGCGPIQAGVYECLGNGGFRAVLSLEDFKPRWLWDIEEWKRMYPQDAKKVKWNKDGEDMPSHALLSEVVHFLRRTYSGDILLWVYSCGSTVPGRSFMESADNTGSNCLKRWKEIGPTMRHGSYSTLERTEFERQRDASLKRKRTTKPPTRRRKGSIFTPAAVKYLKSSPAYNFTTPKASEKRTIRLGWTKKSGRGAKFYKVKKVRRSRRRRRARKAVQ